MSEPSFVCVAALALAVLSSAACDGSSVTGRRPDDAGARDAAPGRIVDSGAGKHDGGGPWLADARTTAPDHADATLAVDASDGSSAVGVSTPDASPPVGTDSGEHDAGVEDPGPSFLRVPGWSVRKRIRPSPLDDVVLEETLESFADASPPPTRVRRLPSASVPERSWSAPADAYISDFCRQPSGAFSVVLVGADRTMTLVRLSADFMPLGSARVRDPGIAGDPHVTTDAGVAELLTNGFALDAARIASVGEDVVATVVSSWNSIIAYRAAFANGAWSEPKRTLVEPPVGLTPFLPIGGSFDTFGALVEWFRSMLDVDENGNAYVVAWANSARIREHSTLFGDGLKPLPGDTSGPLGLDSDMILTKLDRSGARVWSRVIGTPHEDEPYALRARSGVVAVAGRARRVAGFDNTVWDAFVSKVTTSGDVVGTRALPLDASGIFLAVDVLPSGALVLGGSDGWTQNPDGLSVLSFGTKLLLELPTFDGAPVRVPLTAGPRHNELRTLIADSTHVWFGGHEDGPVMHTGDSDPGQIHATGVVGYVAPP